jgi:aryl-alcohol dehydrogenase-like predicted oxidoreductase
MRRSGLCWDGIDAVSGGHDARVADKHKVDIADVATKWVLEKDTVPAVIIGARNANHVDDHRRLGTFQLDAADNAVRIVGHGQ